LSVFKTRSEHEVGIFELGMNRCGEIVEIASVLNPNIGLITNVGSAHIGIIGSKEGIAKEKKDIVSFFRGGETAIIPEESEYAAFLLEGVKGRVLYHSLINAGIKIIADKGIKGWELELNGKSFSFSLPGKHNLENAAAAVVLSRQLGISEDVIRSALSDFKALWARGEIAPKTIGKAAVTVINDCYNANPESMEKALSFFDELEWDGEKIIVLGEMMELGASHKNEHEKLFMSLNKIKAHKKFFFRVSPEAIFLGADKSVMFFSDIEKLRNELKSVLKDGSLLLLKASRSCALERIFV
jgi:UDP-N-acetylmuramoyl-tripeptide--D-alanyl-D-alanine ligase